MCCGTSDISLALSCNLIKLDKDPMRWIDPEVGLIRPAIVFMSVVFPDPLGPIRPMTSPFFRHTDTALSKGLPPRFTVTSCADRTKSLPLPMSSYGLVNGSEIIVLDSLGHSIVKSCSAPKIFQKESVVKYFGSTM